VLPRGDYARGFIASFINRAFGRVSLRGLARAQHAALTAATGSKQHAAGRLTSVGTRGGAGTCGTRLLIGLRAAQCGFTSPARALGWRDLGLAADLRSSNSNSN